MSSVLVVCDEVTEGLRAAEATVAIRSVTGRREFLRTGRDLLVAEGGRHYLEIGVIHKDPESKAFLIEFPQEADSGANRTWVPESSILFVPTVAGAAR